jgi:RimJ/RimL family protein N-acetyltransferase
VALRPEPVEGPGPLRPRASRAYRPRDLKLRDGRQVTLRSIREADAAEIVQAFGRLSRQARYSRFMQHKKSLDLAVLERGVRPVPGREFVFVATVPADDGIDIVGAARYVPVSSDPSDFSRCEFAITVIEDWHRSGLARELMACLIRRARRDGYAAIEGHVLAENAAMLGLARRLRFEALPVPEDSTVVLVRRALHG